MKFKSRTFCTCSVCKFIISTWKPIRFFYSSCLSPRWLAQKQFVCHRWHKHHQKVPGYKKLFDANGNYKATAKLTATEKAQLQAWVTDYFVSSEENVFTDYPFLGSSCKGQFITKSLTTKLEIIDGGSSLSVKLVGSDKVVPIDSKYSYFPFAFKSYISATTCPLLHFKNLCAGGDDRDVSG
jgi:hypothetical protein